MEEKKPMEYDMVGDDGLSMEARLEKYSGETDWGYLRAACMYDVLYYVDQSLDLKDVGNTFMEDDAETIKEWVKKGDLVKLEKLHLDHFDEDKSKKFLASVVSPFVLCQEIQEEN